MSAKRLESFHGYDMGDLERMTEHLGLSERIVAGVLQEALLRLAPAERRLQEQELWNAVTGIVAAAQEDGLIAEEWPVP